MADGTGIEWADATWQPITGCTVVSPGCTNCYAMRLAGTRLRDHPSRAGLTRDTKAGPVWTGDVRFNEEWLDQPLRWRKPRRIFVCAHGDLFHGAVPDEWIDRVFAVMALAPQHQFLVLTKRAKRMRKYLSQHDVGLRWALARPHGLPIATPEAAVAWSRSGVPNVWLGVSIEDQPRADERIPELLATPAVRFISAEPLLGPVDITPLLEDGIPTREQIEGPRGMHYLRHGAPRIDWVIVGGESGPGARPMHPDWARALRDQCAAAGVPFFFKQWGEYLPNFRVHAYAPCGTLTGPDVNGGYLAGNGALLRPTYLSRVGKKAAGRLLDGREHSEFPAMRHDRARDA